MSRHDEIEVHVGNFGQNGDETTMQGNNAIMGPESKTQNKSPEKHHQAKNLDEDANALRKAAEIEDLIAELCIDAPNDAVKFCLRSYQYGKRTNQIEKDINQSKKAVLLETSKFLRIPNCEGKTKNDLSHLILCRIQNLLPDDCGVCKNRYSIKLEECPLLECALCGQGVHRECWTKLLPLGPNVSNCTYDNNIVMSEYVNPFKLPGIHYICAACEEKTIPRVEGKQQTSNKTDGPQPPKVNLLEEGSRNNESTDETDILDPEPASNVERNSRIGQPILPIHGDATGGSSEKSASICRYFRRGTCRHGLRGTECKFSHPKMCRKYLQHGTRQPTGCNLGKRCKFFHPLMCMDSLRKSECYNDDCTYHHVKGTRRQPKHTKNQPGSTNHSSSPPSQEGNKEGTSKDQLGPKSGDTATNKNQAENFLEVVRLLKAELISSMNTQIATLSTQIQSIQQVQAQQMIPHQMINYSHQRAFPPGPLHPPMTSQPLQQMLQQPPIQIQMPQVHAPVANPIPIQN